MPAQPPRPNLIRVAVVAAGGTATVARRFGVSEWVVNSWARRQDMPTKHVVALADLTSGVVSAQSLANHLAERAAERVRAAALEAA